MKNKKRNFVFVGAGASSSMYRQGKLTSGKSKHNMFFYMPQNERCCLQEDRFLCSESAKENLKVNGAHTHTPLYTIWNNCQDINCLERKSTPNYERECERERAAWSPSSSCRFWCQGVMVCREDAARPAACWEQSVMGSLPKGINCAIGS